MARLKDDPRNTYLPKAGLWRTERQYANAYAAKYGVIALERHGWSVPDAFPLSTHLVIAYKHIAKGEQDSGCN